MREFAPKNEHVSRTLDCSSNASRQMSIFDILQASAKAPLGGGAVAQEKAEAEETPLQEINKTDDKGLEKEASGRGEGAVCLPPLAAGLPASAGSQRAIQRVRMASVVTGQTHLVKKNGFSIYEGQQGRLLTHGARITVETSDKIRSRRGPNQEVFKRYDACNPHEYRWIRVVAVGEEDVRGKELYIRDDTFVGGAAIPRGPVPLVFSIDHRRRKKRSIGAREFIPIHAPLWYEREGEGRHLPPEKESTAARKHAKLLAVAFECEIEEIDEAMRAHAEDPDMLPVLETIEQHMTHVSPWIPRDTARDGKDRHEEDYEDEGEYFRTSTGHPLHQAYEGYQRILGLYGGGRTTQPVNQGWVKNAREIMGITNMEDTIDKTKAIPVRLAEHPDRIARGPGAVIGNEAMAREVARLRRAALREPSPPQLPQEIERMRMGIEDWKGRKAELEEQKAELEKQKAELEKQKATLVERKAELVERKAELEKQKAELVERKAELEKQKAELVERKAELEEQLSSLQKGMREVGGGIQQLGREINLIEKSIKEIDKDIEAIPPEIKTSEDALRTLRIRLDFYRGSVVSGIGRAPLLPPRTTDLRPFTALRLLPPGPLALNPFAKRLLTNRRNVHLQHLFGARHVGEVTDMGGDAHPNLILEKEAWKHPHQETHVVDGREEQRTVRGVDIGVRELHAGWARSGLATGLQVRGSFGHHRPSVSPLDNGRVRINPGLYPMSLLQIGIDAAIGAGPATFSRVNAEEDFIHRQALKVAMQHALHIISVDPGSPDRPERLNKMKRIKEFAKHRLVINLRKAQIILKAPVFDGSKNRDVYLRWLENDFVKTALVLENLNESTHLLLTAIVRERTRKGSIEGTSERKSESTPDQVLNSLLEPSPFLAYVNDLFKKDGKKVAVYYVESGMQAITTAAMAAVKYRRSKAAAAAAATAGREHRPAGFIPLHPYFEMKDQTAAAAGFVAFPLPEASTTTSSSSSAASTAAVPRRGRGATSSSAASPTLPPEVIIADLSPVDTKATAAEQSRAAIREGLARAHGVGPDLVPVLDATATPLFEVKSMLPPGVRNFIIVESLTKYAQLGSDKALGGRIIVVGEEDFIEETRPVVSAVEEEADMLVSRIWFETMEDARYGM